MLNKLSPLPKFLIDRYKNWKLDIYKENKDNFNKLAKFGQQPNSMVISCCDSRIHVTSIFGADEGEFFILEILLILFRLMHLIVSIMELLQQ